MKPISKSQWDRYKESEKGKQTIAMFTQVLSDDVTNEDILKLAKKFDPQYFQNFSDRNDENALNCIASYMQIVEDLLSTNDYEFNNTDDIETFYIHVILTAIMLPHENSLDFNEVPQSRIKNILSSNIFLTTVLYVYLPGIFIPNFFPMQFLYLQKIADIYEIKLPDVPNRADYKERMLYYIDMNYPIINFILENQISETAEICAFLYDFAITEAKEQINWERRNEVMPTAASSAWLLVGNKTDGEKNMDYGFWQANELTTKGDIMLFYEKSPVKAMNAIWIAQTDGVKDPFFHYYSNTYIGNKIDIPEDKAITFADFKANDYFQKKGEKMVKNKDNTPKLDENGNPIITHEGNYVAKNFQDCSGWKVTRADYAEIKKMLKAKGFDISILPELYQPTRIGDVEITIEDDVYEKLITPLLNQMGWEFGKDFKREVEFPAGRTKTRSSEKRPDYCLHITEKGNDIEAKVVIEAKKHMKNAKEIQTNFEQGRSYAKWGNAKVLVICDDVQLRVYQQNLKQQFTEDNFVKFTWVELEDGDKFQKLKKILS